ncbi:hypothetical protein HWB90_gp040 [Mycobacterium phage Fowlmouth]|uniref:Uncharacterized protein n=1 Tax=Mycobacterium phage Fowlmouth TaxID=2419978 RepID=A0A3G2KGA4_9CAUD|nr:hypothetical protein HWB90_gp040 [Mycobacterium phage Fowlmouth]AYN57990.1 hypothetical protein SEA_FOWLMOUTH_40 [Mycobacterium phage Fowlmouth]
MEITSNRKAIAEAAEKAGFQRVFTPHFDVYIKGDNEIEIFYFSTGRLKGTFIEYMQKEKITKVGPILDYFRIMANQS